MEILLVILGVAVIGLVVYFATRKQPDQLPPPDAERQLRQPDKPRARTSDRAPKAKVAAEPTSPRAKAPAPAEREAAPAAAAPAAPKTAPAPEQSAAPGKSIAPRALLESPRDPRAMRQGLSRSREGTGFFARLRGLFAGKPELSPELAAEIEEVLIASDVGVPTAELLLGRVRELLSRGEIVDEQKVWQALREEAARILSVNGAAGPIALKTKPSVILFVGVNGAGKTTTIGKLATRLKASGRSCVLAAGDTFRAAAVQQLEVWGDRVGCEVIRGKEGADPGSVIFESIRKAQEIGADVVLADTAGRLHTKANLMSEMTKIAKTAAKALDGAPHEILLVIDATTGQNALAQAREFKEALPLSGIVLTKLDGTAKGGMVLGICDGLQVPVRLIGLGERPADLHEFDPEEFVEALLGRD